jgi:uncharacterized protein YyaL (SSP411 family)
MINWEVDFPLLHRCGLACSPFWKMLYDNAQLVSLYSHAYQLTKTLYKSIVYETLSFIEKNWRPLMVVSIPHSMLTAMAKREVCLDSWRTQLYTRADASLFFRVLQHHKTGNGKIKKIFYTEISDTEIAEKIQISIEQLQTTIKTCKTKLTKFVPLELNQDSMTRFWPPGTH